jgi:hypothetical protein
VYRVSENTFCDIKEHILADARPAGVFLWKAKKIRNSTCNRHGQLNPAGPLVRPCRHAAHPRHPEVLLPGRSPCCWLGASENPRTGAHVDSTTTAAITTTTAVQRPDSWQVQLNRHRLHSVLGLALPSPLPRPLPPPFPPLLLAPILPAPAPPSPPFGGECPSCGPLRTPWCGAGLTRSRGRGGW